MKTRCPHCKLIYNIRTSTLKKADFKVVCSECHHVFTVKGNPDAPDEAPKPPPETDTDIQIEDLQPDEEMQELLLQLQDSLDKQEKRGDNSESDKKPPSDTPRETAPAEKADSDLPDTEPAEALQPPGESAKAPEENNGEKKAGGDSGAKDDGETPFAPELTPPRKSAPLFATLSVILLLCAALLQFAWIEKARLLKYPRLRAAAETVCPYIGCTLPQLKHRIQPFRVVDRTLVADSASPGVYRLDILMRNDSNSAQKLPALQLSLLDHRQVTVARRTFAPQTYMARDNDPDKTVQTGELLEIHLKLQPASADISGFELDFIPADS